MKHKHYDLIIAWANGATIQVHSSMLDVWSNVQNPTWDVNRVYRIKPEQISTRIALFKSHLGYSTLACSCRESEKLIENMPYFVKWLTDWTDYELPEDSQQAS